MGGDIAHLWRTDDANVAAASIAWTNLPGGDNYCSDQCSYDMPVASPSGRPDEVWIGGQMQYDELFGPSNGRTVQRSTDAGQTFTDMTNDRQSPPLGMHPDQHAIGFSNDPGVAFLGSDGGVVRTNGQFVDASADCDSRGLSGGGNQLHSGRSVIHKQSMVCNCESSYQLPGFWTSRPVE